MTISKHLVLKPVESAHFEQNFIRQVVCELRFPTNFDLDGSRPPLDFAKAVRKDYPNYQARNEVNMGPGGVARANIHAFSSKGSRWTVTIRASSISLETTHYNSYADFEKRLDGVVQAAGKVVDSDFFTRIGLRYINAVPFNIEEIREWINPALVGPLGEGIYGVVQEHSQRVSGSLEDGGGYLFQHGVGVQEGTGKLEYALDFDFFGEDIPVTEALSVARKLHANQFAMFMWSLGDKGKEFLTESKLMSRS
jgi:uncharacterized protein (TIGR04255 family)